MTTIEVCRKHDVAVICWRDVKIEFYSYPKDDSAIDSAENDAQNLKEEMALLKKDLEKGAVGDYLLDGFPNKLIK